MPTQPESEFRVLRVLLVEDEPRIRAAIAAHFERDRGFEVGGQAGSLAEARGMFVRADVAILDVGLPDGCGIDLIPELRAVNSQVQVVVLTASRDPAVLSRAIEYGAAAVLDKLTHIGQVVESVRACLPAKADALTPTRVDQLSNRRSAPSSAARRRGALIALDEGSMAPRFAGFAIAPPSSHCSVCSSTTQQMPAVGQLTALRANRYSATPSVKVPRGQGLA